MTTNAPLQQPCDYVYPKATPAPPPKSGSSIKVPPLSLKFGEILVMFPDKTAMTSEKLCSDLWALAGRIESYIKQYPCVLTNKNGAIAGIKITA